MADDRDFPEFPILFHELKKRKWKVWVVDDTIFRNDGLSSKEFVKKPNVRKVTAKRGTSPHEQALVEARRFWVKKIDQGFKPADDDEDGLKMYELMNELKEQQGGNNHGLSKGTSTSTSERRGGGSKTTKASSVNIGAIKHRPMLAQKYTDRKASVVWDVDTKRSIVKRVGREKFKSAHFDASNGCFITTKLDGVHCIAYRGEPSSSIERSNSIVLLTRNGKQFVFLNHVRMAIDEFLPKGSKIVLAGELYVHAPEIDDVVLEGVPRFTFITSACRTVRGAPHENEHQIEFHVFDLMDPENPDLPQFERLQLLKELFKKCTDDEVLSTIKPVRLHVGRTPEDIEKYQHIFSEEGYEGVILRDSHAPFVGGKKCLHLLKYKQFEDAEFVIVGAKCAKGSSEGAVVWLCETENGDANFSCGMSDKFGTLKIRREMYDNYTDHLGKMLTVQHQGLGENGVPRFPVGKNIRDYE